MKQQVLDPRDRILATASVLFHQQGYNATGINQIIEEASVAKASLYQHFKSKEELCIEVLNKRHEFWFLEFKKFTGKEQLPKNKIIAAFDFLIYMNKKESFRGCNFLNILSEIPRDNKTILVVIQQHKKDLINFFQDILVGHESSSKHIYLLFESAIIESQVFRNNWPVEAAKNIIHSLID
jgi:AcrR family transcriptional regulator